MIEGLRPYPDVRPTELPWLGDTPSHWEVRRNGRLFAPRRETGFPELPILEVSIGRGVRVRDLGDGGRKQQMADRAKYQRAVRDDLAYNMMRMWQGAVGVAPSDGLVSPAYVVARPVSGNEQRLLRLSVPHHRLYARSRCLFPWHRAGPKSAVLGIFQADAIAVPASRRATTDRSVLGLARKPDGEADPRQAADYYAPERAEAGRNPPRCDSGA